MTVKLVCGPPGAGKNTYVESRRKEGDSVIDYDVIRQMFPNKANGKPIRDALEAEAKDLPGTVWVIRTLAKADERKTLAEKISADETIIIAPAIEQNTEWLRARGTERSLPNDETERLIGVVKQWHADYEPVESDTVIELKEQKMPKPSDIPGRKKDEDLGNEGGNDSGKSGNSEEGDGFPAHTKIEDMTEPQRTAYWKKQARKHENANRAMSDYSKYREFYESHNQEMDGMSVQEFKAQVKKEMKLDAAPGLAREALKTHLGDRVDGSKIDSLLEGLNVNTYIDDDGSIDYKGLNDFADLLIPAKVNSPRNHQSFRQQEATSSVKTGRDLYDTYKSGGKSNA